MQRGNRRKEAIPAERGTRVRSATQVGRTRRWSRLWAWIPGRAGPWTGLNTAAVERAEAVKSSCVLVSVAACSFPSRVLLSVPEPASAAFPHTSHTEHQPLAARCDRQRVRKAEPW